MIPVRYLEKTRIDIGRDVAHLRHDCSAFNALNITTGFTEKLGTQRQSGFFVYIDKRFCLHLAC